MLCGLVCYLSSVAWSGGGGGGGGGHCAASRKVSGLVPDGVSLLLT